MKFLKIAAAAALVVAAVPSFAVISLSTEGASELSMTVWSVSAKASYLQDLGVTLDTFMANGSAVAGYKFNAPVTSALTDHTNLTGAADLKWMVSVYDINGDLTPDTLRLLTTSEIAAPTAIGRSVQDGTASWFDYIDTNNHRASHNQVANGSSYSTPGDAAYFLSDGGPAGTNNSNLPFSQGSLKNVASNFFYITSSDADFSDTDAKVIKFQNSKHVGVWNFDGSTVSYNLAAAVPEPETYALMLAGLAGLAMMVRRRASR